MKHTRRIPRIPTSRKESQSKELVQQTNHYQTAPRPSIKAIVLMQSFFLKTIRTPAGCWISIRNRETCLSFSEHPFSAVPGLFEKIIRLESFRTIRFNVGRYRKTDLKLLHSQTNDTENIFI